MMNYYKYKYKGAINNGKFKDLLNKYSNGGVKFDYDNEKKEITSN